MLLQWWLYRSLSSPASKRLMQAYKSILRVSFNELSLNLLWHSKTLKKPIKQSNITGFIRKKFTVILKTERFDNLDSAAIISSYAREYKIENFSVCTALSALLMMTAESVLSKCQIIRMIVAYFSSLRNIRPVFVVFRNLLALLKDLASKLK